MLNRLCYYLFLATPVRWNAFLLPRALDYAYRENRKANTQPEPPQ